MQLRDLFEAENSRANTDFVMGIILQKTKLLDELIELIFLKEEPVSRRAIWVLDACDEEHPDLIKPYVSQIIDNLSFEEHNAYRRHSLRILSRHEIPIKQEVKLFDFCLKTVTGNEATAPKLHAINILFRFTQKEPDLKNEVISAIELGIREGSTGLKNIGHKTLMKLNRL